MTMHCAKPGCKFTQWRGQLCYAHFRASQGDVLLPASGKFAKASIQSRTAGSTSRQTKCCIPAPEKSAPESAMSIA